MRLRYSCLGIKLSQFSKQFMVMAGLLAIPFTLKLEKPAFAKAPPTTPAITPEPTPSVLETTADPRTTKLKNFFCRLQCPIIELAEDFVHAADENRLDWRLLPSISVVESGGGKNFRNNNILGWSNGMDSFPTVRSGIHEVAFKLGRSRLYRNRDSRGKLFIYNPDETYVQVVMKVMDQISPIVNLPASQISRRQPRLVYVQN